MALNTQAAKLWKKIRNPNCTDCPLHESAQSVCLVGDGPVPANIMIIGEAPGFREDEIKKPFAGRAGQLLDKTLEEFGIHRSEVFISNVAKCRPPNNRTPTKTEIKACRQYLDKELEYVKPQFILTVGNPALSLIKKSGIMKHRGEIFELDGAKVYPTIHPAAVLRNPRFEHLWRSDVAAFARLVRGEPGATPPRVIFVRTKKTLIAACRAILASRAVAYDVETSGVEDFDPEGVVATIAVAPKPGVAFVIPVHHPQSPFRDPQAVLRIVGQALLYTKGKVIAHNAKFDDRWMNRGGVNLHTDFDSMIAAHLIDENSLKGLGPLAQIHLGVDSWKIDVSKGAAMTTPLKKLAVYNAKDAEYTLRLYHLLKDLLLKEENRRTLRIFTKLMMPVSRTLTQVELHGMWVDKDRLRKRTIEAIERLDKINGKLVKITGTQANWNSHPQLAEILFEEMGLPVLERTDKGAPSSKEAVLLQLQKKHRVAKWLLEWRKWSKWKSTYLERWAQVLDAEDRLHANYKITGTVTGRLSSGKEEGTKGRGLNMQQVPRDPFVRSVIGAPPGWRFVEADFSQVELRIAAHYSQDPTMMRYFQMGKDIHMETAMAMTGKPADQVTKEERKKAKAVNFGFLYGMGAKKFIMYARDNYDVEVTLEEAEKVRARFFEEYSTLRAWHARQRRLARSYKRVQSLIGRVRHLPDIESGDEEVRQEAERQAINSPVQSLASDMMLLAMILLHEKLDPNEAHIVGTVHDSLLLEVREDVVKQHVKLIRDTMENLPLKRKFGVQLTVPVKADVTVGQHWSEGKAA